MRKCLFGEDINQHALKYLEKFLYTYLEQNKMFLFETLEGYEPIGELIGYFDEILFNFLNKFYSNVFFRYCNYNIFRSWSTFKWTVLFIRFSRFLLRKFFTVFIFNNSK